MTATTLPPIPCPACGEPDGWRQFCTNITASYGIGVAANGSYHFDGEQRLDVEGEETDHWYCGFCAARADEATRAAIEGRIR